MSEQQNEEQFAGLFNIGYQMDKFEPELLNKILDGNPLQNETIQILGMGKEQHERDKIMEQQQKIKENNQTKKRSR